MRSNSTLSVLIFTRDITYNPEKLTIYARITVDGKRAEISLKRYTSVNAWDVSKGRVIGTTQKARLLNSYLDEVYVQIMEAHRQLLQEGKIITAQAVKARFLGQDEQHKTLMELVAYHNTNMDSVLKYGTMKNYYSTERYLHKFLRDKFNTVDINLKELNYRFIVDFEQYLRNYKPERKRRTCTNNGTMKHLARLMKMINLALKLEWLEKDPFHQFKLTFQKHNRSYLTERELQLIEETTFKGAGFEKVRNVFLFSCYTGLSYIDVKELLAEQLVLSIDGTYWLYTQRLLNQDYFRRNFIPSMLGWFSMRDNTSIEDIEWMLARSAAFDAGYALVTSVDLVDKNGFGEAILEKIKEWEKARLGGAFSVEQKKRMENIKDEFSLEKLSENSWNLIPHSVQRLEHELKIRQPGEPVGSTFTYDNIHDAQPLKFILTTKNTKVSDITLELDNFKKIDLQVSINEGEYLKYDGGNEAVLYDRSWNKIIAIPLDSENMTIGKGTHKIKVDCTFLSGKENASLKLEIKTSGKSEQVRI